MPFTPTTEATSADGGTVPPLRRERNSQPWTIDRVLAPAAPMNGSQEEDGRTAVLATRSPGVPELQAPPVLDRGIVLVDYDAGSAGRAALTHALASTCGTLVIVRRWRAADPLAAVRAGAGAEHVCTVHVANERAREAAEADVADAVALAQELGRDAIPVVRRSDPDVSLDAELRGLVERHGATQLVVAIRPRPGWRRLLALRSPHERLTANPPCPCTVVPVQVECGG